MVLNKGKMKNLLYGFWLTVIILSCSSDDRGVTEEDVVYRIAYNVLYDDEADDYEVFSMNLDGSDKKQISRSPGVDWVYYAHADKLYFLSDRDTAHRHYFLHEMDAHGNGIRKVYDVRLADSWMGSRKNGSELVVRPFRTVDSAFHIIDLQGNLLQRVEPDLAMINDPTFSPDGSQIYFRGSPVPMVRDSMFYDELFVINVDGTGLKQITEYPRSDTTARWHSYKAGPPRWNLIDNYITYQSMQDGKYSLFATTPDGSRQWKLTDKEMSEGWHHWSPNARWLAIEVFDKEQSQFDIALMNWTTKEVTMLTDTTYKYQQAPVFVEVN